MWRQRRRAALQPIRCVSAALLIMLMLAACAGPFSPVATPTPRATPTPTATPQPTVLFAADWSRGLGGWNATAGWAIVNGALQSDVGSGRSVTIPYQPAVTDYAVEFQLQIVNIPQNGGYFFLVAPRTTDKDGYEAGVFNLLTAGAHQYGLHPTMATLIDPVGAADPTLAAESVHDFEPGPNPRAYRVEVQGSEVSIGVDGRTISFTQTTQTQYLSSGPLRLLCNNVEIRVTALRILTL